MNKTPLEATTDDGWTLKGDLFSPDAPRAVAVLGHAMMVNRRTMDRPAGGGLASHLAGRGLAVLNFDLRGHGESGPTAREGAEYSLDDFARHDLPAMVEKARSLFPGLPVAVVGHSLGGLAALLSAGVLPAYAPDLIVALSVNMGLPSHEPSPLRRALKVGMFVTWTAMAAPWKRFDPRPLRAGTDAEPWAYVKHYATVCLRDRFTSRDGSIDYLEALARVRGPVLFVMSEGDRLLAPPAAASRFMAELTSAEVTPRVVRRGELGGFCPDHMGIVTKSASRPLWDEAADWILERSPAV